MTDRAGGAADLLRALWDAGLAAVDPARTLPPLLPPQAPEGRSVLFALGKAAASMAEAACRHRRFDRGLVIAPHGTTRPAIPEPVTFLTAAHPVPDAGSLRAGGAALTTMRELRPDDRLVALISGGGSALMCTPVAGVNLADKQAVTRRLLSSGAPIADMNRIRAALSQVKGGGLWMACRSREVTVIVMSDVPGDDGRLVASGPFSPDAWPLEAAQRVARHHGIALVPGRPAESRRAPPPVSICAGNRLFLDAAARAAEARGVAATVLGDDLTGDAETLAREHVAAALRRQGSAQVLLSGGEASVRVDHPRARGGRNLTYCLAAALALEGVSGVAVLAADSDGIDGNSGAAGAMVDGRSSAAMRRAGFDPAAMLRANRSHDALATIRALFVTGATGVNVNDFRAVLRMG